MEILNHGDDPTIGSAGRLDVTDINQGSFGLLVSFKAQIFPPNLP